MTEYFEVVIDRKIVDRVVLIARSTTPNTNMLQIEKVAENTLCDLTRAAIPGATVVTQVAKIRTLTEDEVQNANKQEIPV